MVESELPALQTLEQQEQISLTLLRTLDCNQHDQGLEDFGCFLREELQIVHLACHAFEVALVEKQIARQQQV